MKSRILTTAFTALMLAAGLSWAQGYGVGGYGAAGVTDHGSLSGLSDNDHPQYGLLTANQSWSGTNTFTQRVGIGTNAPAALLHIGGWNPTTAAEGMQFGRDVSLYRAAANNLKTDDDMHRVGQFITCNSYWSRNCLVDSLSELLCCNVCELVVRGFIQNG